MRILTGRHRVEYEEALIHAAHADVLQERLTDAQAEIARLRDDLSRERQRADNAVDHLLAERGIAPVTPATVEDLRGRNVFVPDPARVKEVEEQYKALGFGGAR